MSIWRNEDGLVVAFGLSKADKAKVGGDANLGPDRAITVDIEVGSPQFDGTQGLHLIDLKRSAGIPAGALITEATLDVQTAFEGTNATLSLGLHREDGTTAVDADGIDATIAETAIDAVGDRIECDGDLIGGAALANKGFVSATVATADFTAGRARLVVKYRLV